MHCWAVFEWIVHDRSHTHMRHLWCWEVCAIGRWPNQLHFLYHKLPCWTIFEWFMHNNHNARVPGLQ